MADFRAFAAKLDFASQVAIPLSARYGVNVIAKSPDRRPGTRARRCSPIWKAVDVDTALADKPFRLPVQWVNRPNLDFRGFSGTIAGGRVRPGDAIAVAKSGRTSKVARIVTMDGDLPEAVAGDAVTLTLADEVDISRGDVLAAIRRPGPMSPTSSPPICSGWRRRNCCPAGNICSSSAPPRCRPRSATLKHKVDVNTLDHLAGKTLASERGRLCQFRAGAAAGLRSLSRQPRHRRLHPDRPLHQRHGRRRA